MPLFTNAVGKRGLLQTQKAMQRVPLYPADTTHGIRLAAATHLHLTGMPSKRPQAICGRNSLEMLQLFILDDDAQVNGPHSPFDRLDGLQWHRCFPARASENY